MLLYPFRHNLRKFTIEAFYYCKNIFKSKLVKRGEKTVYLDISKIELNRYLYNFISFFQISGYTVYLPKDRKMIRILSKTKGEFLYASWILRTKIKFGKPSSPDFCISKSQLSNNYFGSKSDTKEFHVPMSEYPAFYFYTFETPLVELNKRRKNAIFMSGNLDPTYYYNISNSKFFDVISRREVADFISRKPYYLKVFSLEDVKDFIESKNEHKAIIVDTKEDFRIPFKELKNILVQFDYYLALPGIFIPQSHNLIESMSVGCIPIIHDNYANLFTPALQHMKNAILYNNLDELDVKVSGLFHLDESSKRDLKKNVCEYYEKYLSPISIVNNIKNNDFSKIYIQAEQKSLEFLYKKKERN